MKLINTIQVCILFVILIEIVCCSVKRNLFARHRRQAPQIGQCPPGYYFSNDLCYPTKQPAICPEGYKLQDGLCYPLVLKPCPYESTSTTTTTIPPTTTTTSKPIKPRCPEGYYIQDGMCYPINTIESTSTTTTTTMPPTTTSKPIEPTCPAGFNLQDGMCYPINIIEITSTTTTTTMPPTTTSKPIKPTCPEGFNLQDGMCNPIVLQTPIDSTSTSTTTIPTTATTQSTTNVPGGHEFQGDKCCPNIVTPSTTTDPPASLIRCPYGSVFIRDKCRKVLCSFGEYYKGGCLQAICPKGTVWRGHSCQEPGVITTVIEIENVFISEGHNRPGEVERTNINNITYYTDRPETITTESTAENIPSKIFANECCTILTPRLCKKYGKKWICFNNRLMRCDPNICKYPTMYLKTPKIVYEPPILIMPPNPPLKTCPVPDCDITETVDCSGCSHGRREGCSPYCYQYICPKGDCGFINHEDFCFAYPGEVGCTKEDGCIWDWCNKSN